jgi:hypothetical protein
MVFLQVAAEKKALFLVQLKQIFGPSYFVTALINYILEFLLFFIDSSKIIPIIFLICGAF